MRRPTTRPIRPVGGRGDERAVSDVIGSILLVGITVVTAAGFGLLLFAFDGPVRTTRSELAVSLDPGTDGWGSGDESVRVLHRGGDPLDASATTIRIEFGGSSSTLSGPTSLGSVFGDGKLTIGETWQSIRSIQEGESVTVLVASANGGASVLLANAAIVASQTSSTQPCSSDSTPPFVLQWGQNPGLVTGMTSGTVTVTAQLTDACWGVNPSAVPRLLWRVSPRDGGFTDQGAMTSVGLATWRGVIPAQNWSGLVGQSLQYYLAPVTDLGANSGATETRSMVILSDCGTDVTPPVLSSLVQSPADVRSSTATGVTVTVVFGDDCSGVAQGTAPHLHSRINNGAEPAYTDQTPSGMTLVSANTWQGTIANPTWGLFVGQTLEYFVTGQSDNNGNVGTTPVQSDVIDLLATYTYPATNSATKGSISAFANLQSASDSGAAATLAEGGTAGAPTTQVYNANGVINANGWSGATALNLGANDDVYATFTTNNPGVNNDLQVAIANPPASQGSITSVLLQAEVRLVSASTTNDRFQLQGCLAGGSCTAYGPMGGGSTTDVTMTYDLTNIRPGGGAWSWTDITNLQGVVHLEQQGGRDGSWEVDRVWAEVTFVTTTQSMDIRMDWAGVPSGTTQILDLRYSTTGDTFRVQVCTWVAGSCTTFNTRGAVLNSGGLTTWQYTLLPSEISGGKVAVRFIDVTPLGTVQGNLNIDYARVATV